MLRFSARACALAWGAGVVAAQFGCAPTTYFVRSDHFTLTLPRDWELRPSDGGNPATIVRVPGATAYGARSGLELRLYAWLARSPIEQPTADAWARLALADELGINTAAPPDRTTCAALSERFALFGRVQPAVHALTSAGQHLIIVAGQAQGSLVAAVGVVPMRGAYCPDVQAMQSAMRRLANELAGADLSDRPPLVESRFAPIGPSMSAPVLPAAPVP
jgi:hypothetical protein